MYLYCHHIATTVECNTNVDCHDTSDSCVQNVCGCGSNQRCSGRTDLCKTGVCYCGRNDECSETQLCSKGKCKGMSLKSLIQKLLYLISMNIHNHPYKYTNIILVITDCFLNGDCPDGKACKSGECVNLGN